jgi:aspartate aminotransferase-like enzyme
VTVETEPVGAADYAATERTCARLLRTELDCLIVQGEAIVPLEAAARGLGKPGSKALNVVTSSYGSLFGRWLRASGAQVHDLVVPFDRAVTLDEVEAALASDTFDVVSVVHAEAASGVVNPLREIARLARASGALVAVDAVASVGAEPLAIDDWGLDLVVLSAQKALAGPSGISPVVLSHRAWDWLDANPAAPRESILSLLDWQERWLANGRTSLPVIPHHTEMRLLDEALEHALDVGIDELITHHAGARNACRRLAPTIGLGRWVADDDDAAAIATTLTPPEGIEVAALVKAAHANGDDAARLISPAPIAPGAALRINHAGRRASVPHVVAALNALTLGLRRLGVAAELDLSDTTGLYAR